MADRDEDMSKWEGLDFHALQDLFTDNRMAKAFFDNIGVIKGSPDLDISKFCEPESQYE